MAGVAGVQLGRRGGGGNGGAVGDDGDLVHDDGGAGLVVGVAVDAGDGGDEKDGVCGSHWPKMVCLPLSWGYGDLGDEELAAVGACAGGAGAGVGHGEAAGDGRR